MTVVLSGSVILTGCKPTEKNYKSAYDAAVAKNKAEQTDPDLNLPADGFHRLGEPVKKELDGVSYFYKVARLTPLDKERELDSYGVAIAVYKMPTNCRAQVSNLREEGYEAAGGKSVDSEYYVFAGTYPTLEEAVKSAVDYQNRHKDTPYVGLPGAPVVIQCRR